MMYLYGSLQSVLKKLIDVLMSFWLWSNRHYKQAEELKNEHKRN